MKFERDRWTPLTVTFETAEEAEALHKILGQVSDETDGRWSYSLFVNLGDNLGNPTTYDASGQIVLKENKHG